MLEVDYTDIKQEPVSCVISNCNFTITLNFNFSFKQGCFYGGDMGHEPPTGEARICRGIQEIMSEFQTESSEMT